MKKTTLIMLLFTAFSTLAQGKFKTTTAIVNFEASVPFFEEVKAVNKQGKIVLDPKTGSLTCVLVMRDFHFKMELMEEHFNENYIESHRYPKAVFKGKIVKFDLNDIDELDKEYKIAGKLYLHGKSKEIVVNAFLKKIGGGIQIVSNFQIMVDDFDIDIPYMIANKISKTVNTDIIGILQGEGFHSNPVAVANK
ncbi:YceI family protein [Flavobacterium sp. Fl-77]|uniref:YceI family protein n=1 Tax=Flavobacterium flavipigmentatum TaxID=2893884 RepID=A0AAJ2VWW4_9FLAO|nr:MULTISPECIES: YceI family protein [unclassified Flavobacterium]MDX6182509.1 YceI family protein [Flavobacterium sp. Fl-33]MDX6185578.1 YceI family protein [Flavobacterium sp. Fl-77]UFH38766.1 YceI family protein [Flavobacterium sp. F-70]